MKKLFLLLLACFLSANLAASPLMPKEDVPQNKHDKELFLKHFYYYRYEANLDTVFDQYYLVENHRNDSVYALLLACAGKQGIDGCYAEGIGDRNYYFFKEHPEEFSIVNSYMQNIPPITREKVRQSLFEELTYTHQLENETDDDNGKTRLFWENQYRKAFPRCVDLFPENFHLKEIEFEHSILLYVHDRKDKTANIRNAPNGKIVSCLENDSEIFIDSIQGKWARISLDIVFGKEYKAIAHTESELWIHTSCLGCKFKGKPGKRISFYPKEYGYISDRIIIMTGLDYQVDYILDMKENCIKVQLKNGEIGWVSKDAICGKVDSTCE